MKTFTATLTFPSNQLAQNFASSWTFKTLTGHCMSSVKKDGSRDVTVYDVTQELKLWIDNYAQQLNEELIK